MLPFFVILRSIPASSSDFSRRSSGPLPLRTSIMSIASGTGPIPSPIGWSPREIVHSALISSWRASHLNFFASSSAMAMSPSLEPSPYGMSSTRYFEPTDFFLDMTDARTCPSGSMERGCSMRMSLSSTGARSRAPPQTIHAPTFFTIRLTSFDENETSQNTSIVSAVPAGLVIARDDVFGISTPADATIATTIGVTRFPGTPPIECLSATMLFPHSRQFPHEIIARVRYKISFCESFLIYTDATKAPSSMSLSLLVCISETRVSISAFFSSWPLSFFRMISTDAGLSEGSTSIRVPFLMPYFTDSFLIPISPIFTRCFVVSMYAVFLVFLYESVTRSFT